MNLETGSFKTVILTPGKRILVLSGNYGGNKGTLEPIDGKAFSTTVVIGTGSLKGQKPEGVQYDEDLSKLS